MQMVYNLSPRKSLIAASSKFLELYLHQCLSTWALTLLPCLSGITPGVKLLPVLASVKWDP